MSPHFILCIYSLITAIKSGNILFCTFRVFCAINVSSCEMEHLYIPNDEGRHTLNNNTIFVYVRYLEPCLPTLEVELRVELQDLICFKQVRHVTHKINSKIFTTTENSGGCIITNNRVKVLFIDYRVTLINSASMVLFRRILVYSHHPLA